MRQQRCRAAGAVQAPPGQAAIVPAAQLAAAGVGAQAPLAPVGLAGPCMQSDAASGEVS